MFCLFLKSTGHCTVSPQPGHIAGKEVSGKPTGVTYTFDGQGFLDKTCSNPGHGTGCCAMKRMGWEGVAPAMDGRVIYG